MRFGSLVVLAVDPVSSKGQAWGASAVALNPFRLPLGQHDGIAPLNYVGHRHPAPAVVAGTVGVLHPAPQGTRPPIRTVPPPTLLPPPGPPAPRTTTPFRPPFFQAITFTSAGITSSAWDGWNRTPCSFFRTAADGVALPFMMLERCAELIPARRATSFWLNP